MGFGTAGGSFPKLPAATDPALLAALSTLAPMTCEPSPGQAAWALGREGGPFFVYAAGARPVALEIGAAAKGLRIHFVDAKTGAVGAVIGETEGDAARVQLSASDSATGDG
ncbi:MAG: hypothetical protein ACREIA_13530, partial [Opitutaceae bacterium]